MHLLGVAVALAYFLYSNLAGESSGHDLSHSSSSSSDYYDYYYEQEQGDEPVRRSHIIHIHNETLLNESPGWLGYNKYQTMIKCQVSE